MTRRDFQLIAATLKRVRDTYDSYPRVFAVDAVSHSLADVLAGTNPKFDRARFLSASGVQS